MPQNIPCNFFAILKDDTVRKINLLQNITNSIRNIFLDCGAVIMNNDTEEILFDGNYAIQEEEILYVEMGLPENINEASDNAIGIEVLNLETDNIKTIFWYEDGVYYFQNFDNRKLLRNRSVIYWDNNTYNKLEESALIVENVVNAIYKDGKFYFKSYANANKIFSLLAFFQEATTEEIQRFSENDKIVFDQTWLIDNSNTIIRKQITLIQKSNILEKAKPKSIKTSAKKFNLNIELQDGKVLLPNDKKVCKDILTFLNEQYYIGLITGNKYRTNSKRNA